GPEVNSDLDELYPSLSADGTLYFGVGPFGPTPEADWDIYYAARRGRGFAPRQPITEINTDLPWDPSDPTADWEFNPEISVDGKMLIFTSLRPGGFGSGDLYVSHFHRGKWSEPENLGPAVNTPEDEFHPTLSRDRRTLYFARTILTSGLVPSDFYSIPTRELNGFSRRGARCWSRAEGRAPPGVPHCERGAAAVRQAGGAPASTATACSSRSIWRSPPLRAARYIRRIPAVPNAAPA